MKIKVFLITVILILAAVSVSAEDSDPAILSRGPIPHRGIEFLGVNAIPAQYGEYKYGDDIITVYYTTERIFLSEDWKSGDCGIPELRRLSTEPDSIITAYTDKKSWTAFISFEADADYVCRFIDIYRSRQNYFLNIARDKSFFSFPAFLEL